MSNRRSSFSSSTTSSLAKRHASASSTENHNAGKVSLAKKRAPLTNLTNNISRRSSLVPCATKVAKTKKEASSCNTTTTCSSISSNKIPILQSAVKCNAVVFPKPSYVSAREEGDAKKVVVAVAAAAPVSVHISKMDVSPCKSDGASVSMSVDETMSSCESFKSPDIEYLDNNDIAPAVDSIQRKTFSTLNISDTPEPPAGNICSRDILVELEKDDKVVNVDNNFMDPQLCATFACDIYKHLRASEAKKRPSTDFMESVQKDINPSMRAILIDWLVEVAEEYRLVPDTLYLTVNYIDRYLSGNPMNRQKLQLLGVASMMVASKYEEICAPQVEEFCYITDNTYFKEEVLQMESAVLNYLKFEMTAPTIKCFLRRFVRAAQGVSETPSLQLECLTNYIAELSLLEYSMLCYAPSLIAASAIFLAKFILSPSTKPWNATLKHYTQYQPSDLCSCVRDLHRLCCNNPNSNLPAIREKYSQHKYKNVAKKCCPSSIPSEYFQN
ncbi:cyclin-A1-1-like isoform X1 [Arachis stenosperma]|uniref:cyclin-A1-1-like isoform X1 n=1 Tax=Arachis stenosperma TaxID=217475 RepID=UPI0025ACD7B9|nr:cyclin-A1-1-like isoform X1 [Arachis stenosperma]